MGISAGKREDLLPDSPARKVARIQRLDPERRFLTLYELQALAITPCRMPELARALAYLPARGKETEAVFQIPLQTGIESRFLKRGAAAAGVVPFIFHTSRHTFATKLLTHGVDIYTATPRRSSSAIPT